MKEIVQLQLQDNSYIFIEVEDVKLPELEPTDEPTGGSLPKNVQLTSTATDKVVDVLKTLKGTLSSVCNTVHESLNESKPDEWGIELYIGFKGKASAIPVIVSAESNVSLKIHAKWLNRDNKT